MEYQAWLRDHLLVQRSLQGDAEAWDSLYEACYPSVYRSASRLSLSRCLEVGELNEIVSEAFFRCYQRRHLFRPISRFSTWVCGFVRYVLLEHCRKALLRGRREVLVPDVPEMAAGDRSQLPERLLLQKEWRRHVWLAFYSLSRPHRVILSSVVLGWITPAAARKLVHLNKQAFSEEAERAIVILRRRYLAIYGPDLIK